MRVLSQERRGSNDNVDAVNTSLDCYSSIVHVTSNVGENLGLQAELANCFTVLAGLLGSCRASQLDIVCAKLIEGFGNLDLLSGIEVGIGKSGRVSN